ncbi:uncharacterized protein LOC100906778 [Galendromus occidentalis]|uniref:Uncharacterized protein LOC100906778 n=1 Tax=Galendromus occidentalis TaxID=34638 RepID=A0AAJ6QPS6_9ACAR|nr:uncharacterized protein LOC100906778 [Galendromus occidentalis]
MGKEPNDQMSVKFAGMRKSCVLILLVRMGWMVSAELKDSLPAMNICVFDDGPTASFIDCLIEGIDKDVVERTLVSVRELFPDSSLLETLRYVCKANNDEGDVIIDAVADNISEDDLKGAIPVVWECHDKYLV